MTDPLEKPILNANANMVFNRLVKNSKRLSKWRKKHAVNAYRLYDADIPEYAAAVDVYHVGQGVRAVVQEYAAPKSVEEEQAKTRLNDLVEAVAEHIGLPKNAIIVKARQRQKGKQQYEKSEQLLGHETLLQEGAGVYKVNLRDYLDTGVFLDHRPIRRYMYEHARDKKILNLFCYTATVSVQAALGGATETLSLDMSNTYLDWARRNFLQNKLDKKAHKLKRADCIEWLQEYSGKSSYKYDLIFLDPPSFSNSKRMESVLDIQRDHVMLIRKCMRMLNRGGVLIFSNNLRRFKLNEDELHHYSIENYTKASIDLDFERNTRIHHCFFIRNSRDTRGKS